MFSQRAPPTGLGRILHNTVVEKLTCGGTLLPLSTAAPSPPPPFYRCSLTSSPFLPLLPHLLPLSTATAHVHRYRGGACVFTLNCRKAVCVYRSFSLVLASRDTSHFQFTGTVSPKVARLVFHLGAPGGGGSGDSHR